MRGVICKVNQFDVEKDEWFDIENVRGWNGGPVKGYEVIEVLDRHGDWYALLPEEYEVVL